MASVGARRPLVVPNRFQAEREAVEAVLGSQVFEKSPALAAFLSYICERYFEGEADKIKEYNIAVEALGRPPDFDQKKNSIVRVEAHRLRRRLAEYYATEGAGQSIRIEVPPGTYSPVFRRASPAAREAPSLPNPAPLEIHPSEVERAGRRFWLTILSITLTMLGIVLFAIHMSERNPRVAADSNTAVHGALDADGEIGILAGYGGPPLTDRNGRIWWPDQYFQGGRAIQASALSPLHRTLDPHLFLGQRAGEFRYDIPLRPGTYQVHLYFVEREFGGGTSEPGGETNRLFDVDINGRRVLNEFDLYAEAGGRNVLEEKVIRHVEPDDEGYLRLRFGARVNQPVLNAIRVVPALPGRIRPIRIVMQESAIVDREGRLWMADQYVMHGKYVKRTDLVEGTDKPELFAGERFGNFNYAIPLPPGRYRASFYFSEQWWGPGRPGGGGPGSRVFDVSVNGAPLLRDFDIYAEAGGPLKALVKTFHGLTPNAQGKLIFQFTPSRNYACLNALEIEEETQD
jgi:hypothetical protein